MKHLTSVHNWLNKKISLKIVKGIEFRILGLYLLCLSPFLPWTLSLFTIGLFILINGFLIKETLKEKYSIKYYSRMSILALLLLPVVFILLSSILIPSNPQLD